MDVLHVAEEADAPEADRAAVAGGLRGFNHRHMPPADAEPLTVLLRDEAGALRGGLLASTRWHWLLIGELWVADADRGRGHGRALLARAEAVAWGRGCRAAALDTTEFQARGFYERAGYRVVGTLKDYPPGSRTYCMCKALSRTD